MIVCGGVRGGKEVGFVIQKCSVCRIIVLVVTILS